jgi:hypothetical protein
LFASVSGSTQLSPHWIFGATQVTRFWQALFEQTCPVAQSPSVQHG